MLIGAFKMDGLELFMRSEGLIHIADHVFEYIYSEEDLDACHLVNHLWKNFTGAEKSWNSLQP